MVWVIAGVMIGAAASWAARPGHGDVLAGVTLGVAMSGGFAAVAVAQFARIRAQGGEGTETRMMKAFVGLMTARMIGYVALVLASVFLEVGEPISVGIGLVGGTMVFQALEIIYLRKMQ